MLINHPGDSGQFSLVFEQVDRSGRKAVYLTRFRKDRWAPTPEMLGQGHGPEVYLDPDGQAHVAWCDGRLNYQSPAGQLEQITFPGCSHRPGLGRDGRGLVRLVWYADEVKNVGGTVSPNELIYESARQADGWSEPTIIVKTGGPVQPAVASGGNEALHLAWSDLPAESNNLFYTSHTEYDCSPANLSEIEQAVFIVYREVKYRPPAETIPFCHNQYEALVFAPNPLPAFSNQAPT